MGIDVEAHGHHAIVAKNADPLPMNGGRALLRFSESTAQLAGQSLAGHAQKIEAHAAGPGFEIGAGATAKPPYLQIGIDDHSCRGIAVQHDPVGFLGGIEVHRRRDGAGRGGRLTRRKRRGGRYEGETLVELAA